MTEKQVDLSGQKVENEDLSIGREDAYLMKSALQKCIRQGLVEPAMYWALKLAEVSSWSVWRRLSIIAVEDCGDTDSILAVGELYRIFMAVGKQSKEKGLPWDGKMCVVCAAKILAESPKDRRSDEFVELMDAIEKNNESKLLKSVKDMVAVIPEESFDGHTREGCKMGRSFKTKEGNLFWYEKSSRCVNMTPAYAKWRKWWQELMVHIVEAKEAKQK